jgi:hypothetical protein
MAGIYTAALIAAAIVLAAAVTLLLVFGKAGRRWLYLVLLLLVLPMSAVAYYFVRLPIDGWISGTVPDRALYGLLTMFYAPLTEEPAKLWPLLLPFVWRRLGRENAVGIALALGLGFGAGEIGFLAEQVARAPALAAMPWFSFTGFIIERILICIWHPAFAAVTVFTAARRPALIPIAFLGSAALHFIGNLPIFLAARDFLGLGRANWQLALLGWTLLYSALMALLLALLWLRGRGALTGRDAPPSLPRNPPVEMRHGGRT